MPKYYVKSDELEFICDREDDLIAAVDALKYFTDKRPNISVDGQVYVTEKGFFKPHDDVDAISVFDIRDLFEVIKKQ